LYNSGLGNFKFKTKNDILALKEEKQNYSLEDYHIFSEIWSFYSSNSQNFFLIHEISDAANCLHKQNSGFDKLLELKNKKLRKDQFDSLLSFYNHKLRNFLEFISARKALYAFYLELDEFQGFKINIAKRLFAIDRRNIGLLLTFIDFKDHFKKMILLDMPQNS